MAVAAATLTVAVGSALLGLPAANAASTMGQHEPGDGWFLLPGNLIVSSSVYDNQASNVTVGQPLPPGCTLGTKGCKKAINNGLYPQVFNNNTVDGSFGLTSRIVLDQLTPSGFRINSMDVPADQLVTSFSSKSELALNLSTDGRHLTFMGYAAPLDSQDVSNSNTPGVIDPTNPVTAAYARAAATMDLHGNLTYTLTNAYSGNNGRAAILSDSHGANLLYMAGNAGNGGNPQPKGVVIGAGLQGATPLSTPESAQHPGDPTPVGSFNITQLGVPHDKIGKDTNFRGLTIFDNVVYTTKGSGGNGVDTVYFVDPTGQACPTTGVGLPVRGAPLPTATLGYDPTTGLTPTNMCILQGFPTELATTSTSSFPFGVWFADSHTMYVAQEGNGDNTYSAATNAYTAAKAGTGAGLQKWVLKGGTWTLAYTLQSGLNLGVPYTVAGYPTGVNPVTGLPWAPATDGLRNITGRVNHDGSVSIWGVTSTVSGSGDQGADPNRLVTITDNPAATRPSGHEEFKTVRTAGSGQVERGVSFTPGTDVR
jgi:hypothetical protein